MEIAVVIAHAILFSALALPLPPAGGGAGGNPGGSPGGSGGPGGSRVSRRNIRIMKEG